MTRPEHPYPHETPPTAAEIAAFQVATRDLIDVAVRSAELVAPEVSMSQVRLMIALHEIDSTTSARLAHLLGVSPSSVTRMVDRLISSGHVERVPDAHKRSAVTLTLSELGERIVSEILTWRHAELERLLAAVDPTDRSAAARALAAFHDAVSTTVDPDHTVRSPL